MEKSINETAQHNTPSESNNQDLHKTPEDDVDLHANHRVAGGAASTEAVPSHVFTSEAKSSSQDTGISPPKQPISMNEEIEDMQHVRGENVATYEDNDVVMPLQPFDWEVLQFRFETATQAKQKEENMIQEELEHLMKFYNVWSQIPAVHDRDRAAKRLRTRIAYVHNQELQMDIKRQKHERVVRAFQNALELLETLEP